LDVDRVLVIDRSSGVTNSVDTTKVAGRRVLRFESLDAILAEVEALAKAKQIHSLGNWSAGQNLAHVALTMTRSMDGFPSNMPWVLRAAMRLFMKGRLLRKPMSPGFKAPKRAGLSPDAVSTEEGLSRLRAALARMKAEKRRVPSPFLGELTVEEWNQLHCRHAELHLSFLVPDEA
jgi:hypothetical protein